MISYLDIIKTGVYADVRKVFEDNKPSFDRSLVDQIDISKHSVAINDKLNRPDKTIYKPVVDDNTGEPVKDPSTNAPKTQRSTAKVNRVPAAIQKLIVERRTGFMLGNPVEYNVTADDKNKKDQALIDFIYEIEDNTKTLYKNKEVFRRMISQLEVAELWYLTDETEKGFWKSLARKTGLSASKLNLKMKVICDELGDVLYPLFDGYGDMVAFARLYKLKEDGLDIEHFDVYTAEMTYKYCNREDWALDSTAPGGGKIPNAAKKIPVIYYSQAKPEWADVQGMIDRLEKVLSNHSDMNDYFGEPILAIFGQLIQAINKGESGKILQLSENAKASFLALDSPPESIKMEVENLQKFIYALSQTPNISFEEMKGLGGDLSGFAITLLFLDAHMACRIKEETFGMGIQRRVNLIKAFIGNVINTSLSESAQTVRLKPVFTPYMPKNIKELIEMVDTAVTAKVMSRKTGTEKLENAGFIPDAAMEIERLQEEATEDLQGATL
jgi:SPP1 family phage portal protein